MKIDFLGDSITEGAFLDCHEDLYSALVCKRFGAHENNYGVSGTRIARQRVQDIAGNLGEDYLMRARWIDRGADFLFVFGGTNDFGHGDAPLGNIDDTTPYSFFGAMKCLCHDLLELYGFKKEMICFILPTPRFDQDSSRGDGTKPVYEENAKLSQYTQAEKQVLDRYHIDYLAIKEFDFKPVAGPSEYFADGLHPNKKGHQIIAKELISYLLAKGFH